MYILKNAYTSIVRSKGRNILIGIIVFVIAVSSCVALSIHKSGEDLMDSYTESNPLEVSLKLEMMKLKDASDDEKESFSNLSLEEIQKYGDSDYVKDYYYKNEISVSSNDIEAVSIDTALKPSGDSEEGSDRKRPEGEGKSNFGDFRITAYSDPSYIDAFIQGENKISDGEMFTKDNQDKVIVISSDLATQNDLIVGDTISFYKDDEENLIEFQIIGIYTSTVDDQENNFMGMNAMNQGNQIYTNMESFDSLLGEDSSTSSLTVSYYLNKASDLESFEAELKEKGLSDYYTITTNLDSITESLTPIKNLSNFSFTFLVIVLILGAIILAVIHMMNIRERKYEIGVLRAIGMSKAKVACQLISEIFMVSFVALVMGIVVGIMTSQPITNFVLKNEIESYQSSQTKIEENFGSSEFGRPGFENKNNRFEKNNRADVDYIDTLEVSIDLFTVLQLFGVSLLLTITSGFVTVMYVNQYNPNKILQNR